MPRNNALSEEAALSVEQPQNTDTPNESQAAAPARRTSGPSLLQRLSNESPQCSVPPETTTEPAAPPKPATVVQVGRPMPMPKSKAMAKSSMKPSLSSKLKKAAFGAPQGAMDPRQKKAAVMVGVLSVAFAGVLFMTFGGVGKTQAVAGKTEQNNTTSESQTPRKTAKDWQSPAPVPEDLRNATAPAAPKITSGQTAVQTGTGSLIVKGIVFSKQKPSAIVNDRILSEGDTVNGATIAKITKDTVEFEHNGTRWTQQVQR